MGNRTQTQRPSHPMRAKTPAEGRNVYGDRAADPHAIFPLAGHEVVQLQRMIGNRAAARMIAMQRSTAGAVNVVQRKGDKNFSDIDATQYRISGDKANRKIEVVERTKKRSGQVVYFATGEVTGFNGKRPIVKNYDPPVSLGNWYPAVTHINGMAVAPKSGIESAGALLDSVNEAMGGATDSAVDQSAIDVLYTYSAQRGGFFGDVWDCLKGKVRVNDAATKKQEEIMLDAVARQKRTTVSAHSRGTIKTDNAVRKVHKVLTRQYYPALRKQHYAAVLKRWQGMDTGIGLEASDFADMEIMHMAEKEAKVQMDAFIQLIYAGNAVQYPSSALKPTLFVGGLDFVSMSVGSYTKLISGAKSVGKLAGHGFNKNYSKTVGKAIAQDIGKR